MAQCCKIFDRKTCARSLRGLPKNSDVGASDFGSCHHRMQRVFSGTPYQESSAASRAKKVIAHGEFADCAR
jgi:hypothetical protein